MLEAVRHFGQISDVVRIPDENRTAPRKIAATSRSPQVGDHQTANGVWLTDHVLSGYLSGWPA